MNIKNKILITVALIMVLAVPLAQADEWYEETKGYYTIFDESGNTICEIGSFVFVGDEYIDSDNNRYRVTSVDKENYTAQAVFVEYLGNYVIKEENKWQFLLNKIAKKDDNGSNKVGLYCTHSDESYVPTDGTESEPEEGGIFDVSAALEKELEKLGCEVVRSETPHEPHDAGAYRRSRQTAVDIMEELRPAILADLHRDAVPPEVYEEEIDGQELSKIRMVIGASNQNKAANEEFARELKQIADDNYPGLIKDIYIGKGSYNQDLMPQSILFEMGTHTIDKELPMESTALLADVLAKQMGVTVPDGDDDKDKSTTQGKKDTVQKQDNVPQGEQQAQNRAASENGGTWRSIILTLAIASIIGIAVLFIFNSKSNRSQEFKSFWSELTSIGKKDGK